MFIINLIQPHQNKNIYENKHGKLKALSNPSLERYNFSFQKLPDEDQLFNYSTRENTVIAFSTNSSLDSDRKNRLHKSCSIRISNGEYTDMYAFHANPLYGAGGVMAAALCDVIIGNDKEYESDDGSPIDSPTVKFQNNKASNGGSLYFYSSDVMISHASFQHDIAFYQGGSIYCASAFLVEPLSPHQDRKYNNTFAPNLDTSESDTRVNSIMKLFGGITKEDVEKPNSVFIFNTSFENCQSKEFYGAAAFMFIHNLYFSDCSFISNKAEHSGGALGLRCSMTYIENTLFEQNHCGIGLSSLANNNNQSIFKFDKTKRELSIPRGGGAIVVMNYWQSNNYCHQIPKIELFTRDCNFTYNHITDNLNELSNEKIDFDEEYINLTKEFPILKGCDLLFAGESYYRSYNDTFTNTENDAIGYFNHTINNVKNIFSFSNQGNTTIFGSDPTYFTFHEVVIPDSNGAMSEIYSDIATTVDPQQTSTPTTPYTRLPYYTTSSMTLPYTRYSFTQTFVQKLQSMTPTLSKTPTCSTGTNWIAQSQEKQCQNCTLTFYTFFYVPNQTQSISATSIGATWPRQTFTLIPTPLNPARPDETPYSYPTASQSWWGESPRPAATPSISFYGDYIPTSEPTSVQTPTQEPTPTPENAKTVLSVSLSQTFSQSITIIQTYVDSFSSITETILQISVVSATEDVGYRYSMSITNTIQDIYTKSLVYSQIPIYIPSYTEMQIVIFMTPEEEDAGLDNVTLILIVVCGAVVFFVLLGVVWWLVKRGKAHSDDDEEEEEDNLEETNREHSTTGIEANGIYNTRTNEGDQYAEQEDDTWL